MFDLDKHNLFLEDVKNNPDRNDHSGIHVWKDEFCPNCYSNNGWEKVLGGRWDMRWSECKDCQWKGDEKDVLSLEEYKNIKRSNMIEKMIK